VVICGIVPFTANSAVFLHAAFNSIVVLLSHLLLDPYLVKMLLRIMLLTTCLALYAALVTAIPTITAVGSKFFTSDGKQFFVKGRSMFKQRVPARY
jgi:hypothetical protein